MGIPRGVFDLDLEITMSFVYWSCCNKAPWTGEKSKIKAPADLLSGLDLLPGLLRAVCSLQSHRVDRRRQLSGASS